MFLITASLVFFILLAVFFPVNNYLIKSISKREEIETLNKLQAFHTLLKNDLNNLSIVNRDWATWNETFNYIESRTPEYVSNNLTPYNFSNININFFAILDKEGNLIISRHFDTLWEKFIYNSKDWIDYIDANKKIITNHEDIESSISRIISVNDYPALISCMPITNSTHTSIQNGTLIMGRYISNSYLKSISDILNIKDSILELNFLQYDRTMNILKSGDFIYSPNTNPYKISRINDNKIEGYSIINGVDGKPIFILKITTNRDQYQRSTEMIKFFALMVLIAIMLIFAVFNHLLQKYITTPIEIISGGVSKVDFQSNNFSSITLYSNDEIGQLSSSINNMLMKIQDYNKQLSIVLDGANAGYWVYDISLDKLTYNSKFISIIENSEIKDTCNMKSLIKLVHKGDIQYVLDVFRKNVFALNETAIIEHRVLTNNGNYKWILTQGRVVDYDEKNKPLKLAGIITDIDSKKQTEYELNYLTYYDKLTNVYNRGYYEYIISKIDSEANLPLTIIIGDLNGLKITNDTFGHSEGDKLLKKAAEIFKISCSNNAIICRWGGDEFTILIPNTDENEGEKICAKIKEKCNDEKNVKINIALGYSTKKSFDETIDSVIADAEEKMYRNKLLEHASSRNSIISSLTKTLWEKSFESEEHSQRIFNLCTKVGDKLNLTSSQLDELWILAKLHDIGNLAISDDILNKVSPLTREEWDIMKTHTEIGYRIATSAPDLRPIAYAILSHHEKYDGTGYPNRLKGEEIPFLARLLCIVDAYDVMTHDRPYKKALSQAMAINELKKNSGTQFDPDLLQVCIEVFENE